MADGSHIEVLSLPASDRATGRVPGSGACEGHRKLSGRGSAVQPVQDEVPYHRCAQPTVIGGLTECLTARVDVRNMKAHGCGRSHRRHKGYRQCEHYREYRKPGKDSQ